MLVLRWLLEAKKTIRPPGKERPLFPVSIPYIPWLISLNAVFRIFCVFRGAFDTGVGFHFRSIRPTDFYDFTCRVGYMDGIVE